MTFFYHQFIVQPVSILNHTLQSSTPRLFRSLTTAINLSLDLRLELGLGLLPSGFHFNTILTD